MAFKRNSAEGGTVGQTATFSRTGDASGDQFSGVNIAAPGTFIFSDVNPLRGFQSYLASQVDGSALYLDWDDANASPVFTCRWYFAIEDYPAVTTQFGATARGLSTAGIRTEMDATGHWRLVGTSTGAFSPVGIVPDTIYRGEMYGVGGGTSAAEASLDIYLDGADEDDPPVVTRTITGQTAPLFQRIRYGKLSTAGALTWRFDDLAQNIGSSTPLGATASGDAGADFTVEPYQLVELNGFGVGVWSQTSGPAVTLAGSGASRTFVAPGTLAGVELGFDFGGDPLLVTVLPATERAVRGGVLVPMQIQLVQS